MRIFLDFEASSLAKAGYPIEVGWVAEDGTEEAHLIRPAPDWTDWDAEAAAVHGIARETLVRDGEPHDAVAARMIAALAAHELYASAPSWDGKWLSLLLRAAGHPRHTLRLRDTEIVFIEAARARLGPTADEAALTALVAATREAVQARPAAHRAVADAQREWDIWRQLSAG